MSIIRIPTRMVVERMNEMGYDIEFVEFDSSSTETQAAVSGEIDVTSVSMGGQMTAMDAGFDHLFFLVMYNNEFNLVSTTDFSTCESLDGESVAFHSQTSTDGLIVRKWFEDECPEANPDLVVLEGSDNRVIALAEGQVTAATLGIDNMTELFAEQPDTFHVVAPFPEIFPTYAGSFSASPEWLEANEQLVKDFISLHLDVWSEIYADPDVLLAKAEELMPEADPETLPLLVENYLAAEIFPPDGGMEPETVQLTFDIASDAVGGFTTIDSIEDVMDRSFLEEVRAER